MDAHNNKKSKNNLSSLRSALQKMDLRSFLLHKIINVVFALLAGMSISLFWYILDSESIFSSIFTGTVLAIMIIVIGNDWVRTKKLDQSLLLALDIKYPDSEKSIYNENNWNNDDFEKNWEKNFSTVKENYKKHQLKQIFKKIAYLMPVFFIFMFLWVKSGDDYLTSVQYFFKSFSESRVKIKVIEGSELDYLKAPVVISLNSSAPVKLSPMNLVSVDYTPLQGEENPVVQMKKSSSDESIVQSYQMNEIKENGIKKFRLEFAVSETSFLVIPNYSKKELVSFLVQEPDGPKVTLEAGFSIPEQWLDDKPLPLSVKVSSKVSLQSVDFLIVVDGKHFTENIYISNGQDLNSFAEQSDLILDKYVESDSARVEIVAQAVDKSLPKPIIGLSRPIVINTVSNYGRYRKILSDLKTYKDNIDLALSKTSMKLQGENEKILDSVKSEADQSPFFDSVDRNRLEEMKKSYLAFNVKPDLKSLYQISQTVGRFLHEHEMLDDRERDSDFFVAARVYSHLIEENSPSLKSAGVKISEFLKERQRRWEIRTKRLRHPETLKRYTKVVQNRYILNEFEKVREAAEKEETRKNSLRSFSVLVSFYKQWTEELEKLEDKEREDSDKERDKGLVSALEMLKKLQRKQVEVSKYLHGSDTRSKEDLEKAWPSARMHQNTNIEESKKLSEFLSQMAPRSTERLNMAIESMNLTIQNGELAQYPQAESFADLASRLLHQASKMTEEERQNRRKAFRNSYGKYYGQPVVNGDVEIEHEYKVNPRYREEVLEEVLKSDYQGDNQIILNNFLKRIIR